MNSYWKVVGAKGVPIALVKNSNNRAFVLAGNSKAADGFRNGRPCTLIDEPWHFEQFFAEPYYPIIGEIIDELGPVLSSTQRLIKERELEIKQRIASAKRVRAKNLCKAELAEIQDLLSKEVSQKYIADKYGVSKSFIQRFGVSNRRIDQEYRGCDSRSLEGPEIKVLEEPIIDLAGS